MWDAKASRCQCLLLHNVTHARVCGHHNMPVAVIKPTLLVRLQAPLPVAKKRKRVQRSRGVQPACGCTACKPNRHTSTSAMTQAAHRQAQIDRGNQKQDTQTDKATNTEIHTHAHTHAQTRANTHTHTHTGVFFLFPAFAHPLGCFRNALARGHIPLDDLGILRNADYEALVVREGDLMPKSKRRNRKKKKKKKRKKGRKASLSTETWGSSKSGCNFCSIPHSPTYTDLQTHYTHTRPATQRTWYTRFRW